MTGKLMDRWLKRKAPDNVSNQGLLAMLILLMNLINKKPLFVFQPQRKSIGRRRSNLHPVRLIVYVAYKSADDVLL